MWSYRARLLKVIDGDTVRVLVDLGFYARHQVDIRLAGVRAPELNDVGGQDTKKFVELWMSASPLVLNWPLYLETSTTALIEPIEKMTFYRYVGIVRRIGTSECLNDDIGRFLDLHPEWGIGE